MIVKYNEGISYAEKSIGKIYLTGGGFVKRAFDGIGVDSRFGWLQMVWKTDPKRSTASNFTNMDDIDVYLIPRCEITIGYQNIHDYMDLRKILGRERYFMAEFFDTDSGKWVEREMYCSQNDISKFFTLGMKLIGARDYTIKLVGTNNDIKRDGTLDKQYTISYNATEGSGTVDSQLMKWGGQATIADGSTLTAPTGKRFKWWEERTVVDGQTIVNGYYVPNQKTTIWGDKNLYAVWEA